MRLRASQRIALLLATLVALSCAGNEHSLFEDVGPADEVYAEGMRALEGRRILGIYPWINYDEAIDTWLGFKKYRCVLKLD